MCVNAAEWQEENLHIWLGCACVQVQSVPESFLFFCSHVHNFVVCNSNFN